MKEWKIKHYLCIVIWISKNSIQNLQHGRDTTAPSNLCGGKRT